MFLNIYDCEKLKEYNHTVTTTLYLDERWHALTF